MREYFNGEQESQKQIVKNSQKTGDCLKLIRNIAYGFLLMMMLPANYMYSQYPRQCTANQITYAQCLTHFFQFNVYIQPVGQSIILISLIFASCLTLAICNLIHRFWIIPIFCDLALMLIWYHQPQDIMNFSFVYTDLFLRFLSLWLTIFGVFGALIWSFLYISRLTKQYFLTGLIFIAGLVMIWRFGTEWILQKDRLWYEGINGKRIQDFDEQGQAFCRVQKSHSDWRYVFDGLLDLSLHVYDCTKHEFKQHESSRNVLKQYVESYSGQRYIAFPDPRNIPNPFWRVSTQEYLLNHSRSYESLSEIDDNPEYVLDTKTLAYTYKVFKPQYKCYKELVPDIGEKNLSISRYERKPFKNMISIFIDTLSRHAFASRMPKCFRWFEQYKSRNQNIILYQGFRAHSIATFTYHNIMAYLYAVTSQSGNVYKNSPFSLIDKATNYIWVESQDMFGRKSRKKEYKGGLKYSSILSDLKQAGYITGMSSTDCAINPLTQENLHVERYLENLYSDHMGIVQSCDPNYFLPDQRNSGIFGPYSVFRRCLYGTELIDYTLQYAQQFLTKYADQPKYLSLEYLEAHEQTYEVIKYQDEKLYNLLNWLEANGHLDDSILILMSDHGLHMSPFISNSYMKAHNLNIDVGQQLMILAMQDDLLTPEDISNLLANEQKLTSMFELHYLIKYLTNTQNTDYYRKNSLVGHIPSTRTSLDLPPLEDKPPECLLPK